VLSSCSLPLDYVDALAALQTHSGLSQSASILPNNQFSHTVQSSILERFYGFGVHDLKHIRMRRVARDTLRLLMRLLSLCYYTSHTCHFTDIFLINLVNQLLTG